MSLVWKFRVLALIVAAPLAAACSGNIAAELFRSNAGILSIKGHDRLAARLAPLRADIQAESALAVAQRALAGEDPDSDAGPSLRHALSMSPLNSRMWATAAALNAQTDSGATSIPELLKLSYYTGPRELAVIPLRLEVATSGTVLNDADLKELAIGDVSALLSPVINGGRQILATVYSSASSTGKAFIEQAVRAIDPGAVDALRRPAR